MWIHAISILGTLTLAMLVLANLARVIAVTAILVIVPANVHHVR